VRPNGRAMAPLDPLDEPSLPAILAFIAVLMRFALYADLQASRCACRELKSGDFVYTDVTVDLAFRP